MNFKHLGLKKLIATSYNEDGKGLGAIYEGEPDDSNVPNIDNVKTFELEGDGDFRSNECIKYLKESDIVVTNPPFSLFRVFVDQLMEYEKSFLIIGNVNAITYKEFFPLLKDNKVWLGYNKNNVEFRVHEDYPLYGSSNRIDEEGNKYISVKGIRWFTNLDNQKIRQSIILTKKYNSKDYPKYDNYNAIEVNRVKNIPMNYDGYMGVPITFMDKYNPEQFQILGMTKTPICFDNKEEAKRIKFYKNVIQYKPNGQTCNGGKINDISALLLNEPLSNRVYYTTDDVDGYLIALYPRILIKRKQ